MRACRDTNSGQNVQRGARRHPVTGGAIAAAVLEAASVAVDRLRGQRVPDRGGRLVEERAHAAETVIVTAVAVIMVVAAAATVMLVAVVGVEAEVVVLALEAHVGAGVPVLGELHLRRLLRPEGRHDQAATNADHLAGLGDHDLDGGRSRLGGDDAGEIDRLLGVLPDDLKLPALAVVLRLRTAAVREDNPTVDLDRRHQPTGPGRNELGVVGGNPNDLVQGISLGHDLEVGLPVVPRGVIVVLPTVLLAAGVMRRKLGHVILHRLCPKYRDNVFTLGELAHLSPASRPASLDGYDRNETTASPVRTSLPGTPARGSPCCCEGTQ